MRYAICVAYAALEYDRNEGGVLQKRGRRYSVSVQLRRMGVRLARDQGAGFAHLATDEERNIYVNALARMGYTLSHSDPSHADILAYLSGL